MAAVNGVACADDGVSVPKKHSVHGTAEVETTLRCWLLLQGAAVGSFQCIC